MPTDVITLIEQFIQQLLGDRGMAAQYAADPAGTLAANGITEHDLSGVDMRQVVGQACSSAPIGDEARSALQSYSSGGTSSAGGYTAPAPAAHQSVEQVMQHLNYVTYVTYKDDHSITENLDKSTHHEQNTAITVKGPMSGDISVDSHDMSNTGDGAVQNSGNGDVNAATGDHAQAIGGDNNGQANTGDGAVQVGHADGNVVSNTGTNTGVIAGGSTGNTVVGHDNQTAQHTGNGSDNTQVGNGNAGTFHSGGGIDNSGTNFGSGHVDNASGNLNFGGGAVSAGSGGAHNVSGNTVDHGSGLATEGSAATGHDTTTVNLNLHQHLPLPHPEPVLLDHAPLHPEASHFAAQPQHEVIDLTAHDPAAAALPEHHG